MFLRHAYRDEKRGRLALYTSFSSTPDSLGFHLLPSDQCVKVLRNGQAVMEYHVTELEKSLLEKHSRSAFVFLEKTRKESEVLCMVTGVVMCHDPSIGKFLELIQEGKIYLDLTMSLTKSGMVKDHGHLWRCRFDSLPRLYETTKAIDFRSGNETAT